MFTAVGPYQAWDLQQRVLEEWERLRVFERSVALHPEQEKVFYDGPPFPTGAPHHGTVLVSVLKDLVARYLTMRGYSVPRRWGWDCHGLPIETQAEQQCGISEKTEIPQRFGVTAFNAACREIVSHHNEAWRTYIREIGRWVDYDHAYRTMDVDFMESVLWVFRTCYDKGFIYQDYRVTPYCTRCETSLSISDARESDATRPRQDPSVVVRFQLADEVNGKPVYALAWTTTPWTLPSNLALGVSPALRYVFIDVGDAVYLLAKSAVALYPALVGAGTIIDERLGEALVDLHYRPIYLYFANREDGEGYFRILPIDFVDDSEGTGIVHLAPAFGEDDYWACKAAGISAVCPVDSRGLFTADVAEYAGKHVLEANRDIMRELKARGVLLDQQTIEHNYPHCWRCGTPLIYRAMDAWYLNIERLKPALLRVNDAIHWVPDAVKEGRFGIWLRNARDWNISRNRFWGTPLPVWVCDRCGQREVLGSREEIRQRGGHAVEDLHKEVLDAVTFTCPCGGDYRRVPEVLDCWFETGAMPYAQAHYPFEHEAWLTRHFPADFIIEYTGQLRCWFYYLHVLAVALFDRPAFSHCIVHGTILARDGKKISKSKKNYTDPMALMRRYGSDALRLYLVNSNAAIMGDLYFDDDGVKAMVQQMLLPLWNAYSFFVSYAIVDGWSPAQAASSEPADPLDRWILTRLLDLREQVTPALDAYQLDQYVAPLQAFVDDLTNWYIRRSRRRFWRAEMDADKQQAYRTLFDVLVAFTQLLAPVAPFISEAIYRNLTGEESVHLSGWPELPAEWRAQETLTRMAVVRKIVTLGLSLRAQERVKVRQPLGLLECALPMELARQLTPAEVELVSDELNVKTVRLVMEAERFAETCYLPDLKRLGPVLGPEMPLVAKAMRAGQIQREGGLMRVWEGQREWMLDPDMVLIRYDGKLGLRVASDGDIVVVLDATITPALREEGLAREMVRVVQDMRKQAGYAITDRILLEVEGQFPTGWSEYLRAETMADYGCVPEPVFQRSIEGDEGTITLSIMRHRISE